MRRFAYLGMAGGLMCALLTAQAKTAESTAGSEPVDLSAPRGTLKGAVQALGERMNTRLEVAESALAARPVMVYLRRRSYHTALNDLAEFVATRPGKCQWVPIEGGHRLREDTENRNARLNGVVRRRIARARQLEADIKAALRVGVLSSPELAREQVRYPELVASAGWLRPSLGILASLNPTQRSTLLSGKGQSIPVGEFGLAEQQYATTMLNGVRGQRTSVPPDIGGGWIEWRADRDLPATPVSIRVSGQPDRPGVMVSLALIPGSRVGYMDLLHPPVAPRNERPEWLQEVLDKRDQEAQAARRKFLDGVSKDPQLAAKITLNAVVDVPDEKRKNVMVKRHADLSAVLAQVADKAGLSVVGDYDPCWDDYYTRLDLHNPDMRFKQILNGDIKDLPVWQVMEEVAKQFRVEWEKKDAVLFVRSPRIPYALMDGVDVLDPAPLPNHFQKLRSLYRPGQPLPGVTYDGQPGEG